MPPHEQRVVDEKTDLDGKIERLEAFTQGTPTFEGLPETDRALLNRQLAPMREYSKILGERIARFAAAPH